MNRMLLKISFVLFLAADLAMGQEYTNWFPSIRDPPKVSLKLPSEFRVFSATPQNVDGDELDMTYGVFWCDAQTGSQYERQKTSSFKKLKAPLFFVRLSSDVGQEPGTDTFTCESQLEGAAKTMSFRKSKSEKRSWGTYPLLIWTGERADGTEFHSMWIGLNTPDGWTILVDYRTPLDPKNEVTEYERIWTEFVQESH